MTLRRRSYLAERQELNVKNVKDVLDRSGIRSKVYERGGVVFIEFPSDKDKDKARKRLGSGWGGHFDTKRGVWVWRYSPPSYDLKGIPFTYYEGKSAEMTIRGKPRNPQEWKRNRDFYKYDAVSAVKKVFTWGKGEGEFQSSVIRLEPSYPGERVVDYVFQIYRLNPDFDKSDKLRVFVFEKGRINEFSKFLGDVDTIRTAKKLARDWLIDRVIVLRPKKVERISMRVKMAKMP